MGERGWGSGGGGGLPCFNWRECQGTGHWIPAGSSREREERERQPWHHCVNPPWGPGGTISGDIRASVAPAAAQPPIASLLTQPASSEDEKKGKEGKVFL